MRVPHGAGHYEVLNASQVPARTFPLIQSGHDLFQAKGHDFSLNELLGGDPKWTGAFADGNFATIYLSPRDYHRIHMPITGTLKKMIHKTIIRD